MNKTPLKVYDARWEVGEFSRSEVEKLFLASCVYGRELDIDTVVIARDVRLGCSEVLDIAVETAMNSGYDVYLCQNPISTPQSYYNTFRITEHHPQTMGWTITASHNPGSYIGVKFVTNPVRAVGMESGPSGGLTRIQHLYDTDLNNEIIGNQSQGSLHLINYTQDYILDSLKWADVTDRSLEGMTIVLDALNGSAGTELFMGLEKAGVEIIPLRIIPDGYFPTGAPNPTSDGKLDKAIEIARKRKNCIVIGLDGDGDRIVFGDGEGLFSTGTSMIPILNRLKELDSEVAGEALCDPKVDPPSLDGWSRIGYKPVVFRNGHSQIKEYMMAHGIKIAAEESGHYYHMMEKGELKIYCENSLLTILLFLKAIKENNHLMTTIKNIIKTVFTTGEMNFQFHSDQDRDTALEKAVELLKKDGAMIQNATDDGIDLQGLAFVKNVDKNTKQLISDSWYCGFYRISTNEKAVARFYISSGFEDILTEMESRIRQICEVEMGGKRIE